MMPGSNVGVWLVCLCGHEVTPSLDQLDDVVVFKFGRRWLQCGEMFGVTVWKTLDSSHCGWCHGVDDDCIHCETMQFIRWLVS